MICPECGKQIEIEVPDTGFLYKFNWKMRNICGAIKEHCEEGIEESCKEREGLGYKYRERNAYYAGRGSAFADVLNYIREYGCKDE
mgnify:CR=1 FL=1